MSSMIQVVPGAEGPVAGGFGRIGGKADLCLERLQGFSDGFDLVP